MKKTSIFRMIVSSIKNIVDFPTFAAAIVLGLVILFAASVKAQPTQSSQFISQLSEASRIPGFRLLSFSEKVMTEPFSEEIYISKAKKTFPGGIQGSSKFYNQSNLLATNFPMVVREITEDMTFAEMFIRLTGGNLEKAVVAQKNIISICEEQSNNLCEKGSAAIFLTMVQEEYLVLVVDITSDGLRASWYPFGDSGKWLASYHHRVIVPNFSITEFNSSLASSFRPILLDKELFIEGLFVDYSDGKNCLPKERKIFNGGIINFPNWFSCSSKKTDKSLLGIAEVVQDMTFAEMFMTLTDGNLDSAVKTQSQIADFCKKYPSLFYERGASSTFFLTEVDETYWVVVVDMSDKGLRTILYPFGDTGEWLASYHNCIVASYKLIFSDEIVSLSKE